MKIKINPDLLPVKGQYFLYNAGTAPLVPYLSTYARQLGFSSVVVGIIYTILPVMGMLAKPLFGAIADHFQRQKMMFIFFEILTLVTFFAIQFVPEVPIETNTLSNFDCGEGMSYIKVCSSNTSDECSVAPVKIDDWGTLQCQMLCSVTDTSVFDDVCKFWNVSEYCRSQTDNSLIMTVAAFLNDTVPVESCFYFSVHEVKIKGHSVLHPSCSSLTSMTCKTHCNNTAVNNMISVAEEVGDVAGLYQFWLFFILMIMSWVGMAVIVSVGDAICFGMLGDQPSHFGQQRLWGAVGWGTFSILTGVLVDEFSRGQTTKDYTVAFYIMLVMMALDVLVSSRLKYTQTKLSTSIIHDVGKLFTEIRIIVFLIWTIVVGLCTAMLWQFLFWHIEDLAKSNGCDTYGWVKTLQGLINGVQSFGGELPFFFLSGVSLGSLIGGILIDKFGGAVTFLVFGIGALICFVLHITVQFLLGDKSKLLSSGEEYTRGQ